MSSEGIPKLVRQLMLLAIVFAALAILLGIYPLSEAILPHIIRPGDGVSFQEITDGYPVPRLLTWSPSEFDWLSTLASSSVITLWCIRSFLFLIAFSIALPVLNPYFLRGWFSRNREGAAELESNPEDTAELSHFVRACVVLIVVGLPCAVLLMLSGAFARTHDVGTMNMLSGAPGTKNEAVRAFRYIVPCMALWIGFAPTGLAGHFDKERMRLSMSALPGLAGRGALFGLVLYGMIKAFAPYPLLTTLLPYSALGTFNIRHWHEIATHFLLGVGLIGIAMGTLLVVLGSPDLSLRRRLTALLVPVLALATASVVRRPMNPIVLANTLDWTYPVAVTAPRRFTPRFPTGALPDGPLAGLELAKRTGIALGPSPQQPNRNLLVFSTPVFGAATKIFTMVQNG